LKKLADLGLKKSPMHLAAEHTVMIDLSRSEDELLAAMRRQTRYEVRRAGKLGITVERGDSEELFREFHEVQLETAKRQGFVPPSLRVLLAEREAFLGTIWIYIARTGTSGEEENDSKSARSKTPNYREGEAIAYGLIIHDGNEGDYYEAASTDLNRKMPGAYALLWQVMKDLKAEGYERFNLWGIAPAGQPNHRYAGVTTFKTGFGGEVVEYVPAHDLVISKVRYMADFAFETLRKKRRHL
jgi:lipid II:glycine glycyltransferase (peptidoglycan interpeptide bridge formation enzyme)